jgi:hypothetical protein
MWVTILSDHEDTWHYMATKWNDDIPKSKFFMFVIEKTILRLYMSTDGDEFEMVAEAEDLLAEHGLCHACFTAQAGGNVLIFVDGVPVGSPGSFAPASFPIVAAPLIIGCKANHIGTANSQHCGDFVIDSFMLWDRVLSATEIYRSVYLDTYNPSWGQLASSLQKQKCQWDDFYFRIDTVDAACCGPLSPECPDGLPASCDIDCAKVSTHMPKILKINVTYSNSFPSFRPGFCPVL